MLQPVWLLISLALALTGLPQILAQTAPLDLPLPATEVTVPTETRPAELPDGQNLEGHLIRLQNRPEMRELSPEEAELWPPVFEFYQCRQFRYAWFSGAAPRSIAREFAQRLSAAGEDGFRPEAYGAAGLSERVARAVAGELDHGDINLLETDLTFAFMKYARHLARGRVKFTADHIVLFVTSREVNLTARLEQALASGSLEPALRELNPPFAEFWKLRESLARYRALAATGDWPVVPDGPLVKPGGRASAGRLSALRQRLQREGFLAAGTGSSTANAAKAKTAVYGRDLSNAVIRFQQAYGLHNAGLLGPETMAQLNVPLTARIRQIELNLERWRWLPDLAEKTWIRVDIGRCQLAVFEQGAPKMTMKIIVGQRDWSTPQFIDQIAFVSFNPTWFVPAKIAAEEIAPMARKDSSYVTRNGYYVVDLRSDKQVEPDEVAWDRVTGSRHIYGIRQRPGSHNALGPLKFVFSRNLAIYLHGTPSVNLFNRASRTFSHGCIRVEKPIELAAFLLNNDPKWTRDAIVKAIDSGGQTTVRLAEPVPAVVLYWTAMAGDDGVAFSPDVYGLDEKLEQALAKIET